MITRIKDLREDNDLTQCEISKMLNISQVAYSYYELNKRNIPLEILVKLADFYNTSVDYLLYRTNNKKPYNIKKISWINIKTKITSYNILGDFMFDLNNLSGCEIVTLANIIAIGLSQNLTSDELAILGGFFTIIGDSLSTLAAASSNNCSN